MVFWLDTAFVTHTAGDIRPGLRSAHPRLPQGCAKWSPGPSLRWASPTAYANGRRLVLLVGRRRLRARGRGHPPLRDRESRLAAPRRRERLPYPRTLVAPRGVLHAASLFRPERAGFRGSRCGSRTARAVSQRIVHGAALAGGHRAHAPCRHAARGRQRPLRLIFFSAVNRRLGDGRGPFFVVLAGALGNLVNALWHRERHLSSALRPRCSPPSASSRRPSSRSIVTDRHARTSCSAPRRSSAGSRCSACSARAPTPICLAHLFGLLAGFALALPFALSRRRLRRIRRTPSSPRALTVALVGASWGTAWR